MYGLFIADHTPWLNYSSIIPYMEKMGISLRDLNQSKTCVWGWLRLKDWDWKIDFYFQIINHKLWAEPNNACVWFLINVKSSSAKKKQSFNLNISISVNPIHMFWIDSNPPGKFYFFPYKVWLIYNSIKVYGPFIANHCINLVIHYKFEITIWIYGKNM